MGSGSDALVHSRMYFTYSGPAPTSVDCTFFATAAREAFAANLKGYLTDNGGLISVDVTDLSSDIGAVGSDETAVAGTEAGAALPISVAAIVNYKIARRYRGGRPRGFWPFFTVTDLEDPNTWKSASTSALVASFGDFVDAIVGVTSGGVELTGHVNVHYFEGYTNVAYGSPVKYRRVPTPVAGGPTTDPVNSYNVRLNPGSQRRRILQAA